MAGDDAPAPVPERKLATIVAADVVGYSRHMNENEEAALEVLRGHRQIYEGLLATHRGRLFNTAGDAFLSEFNSAVDAVRFATDLQSAIRTRNDQLPAERRMPFRVGINLGDVIVQGGDLLGDGVNIAARLQASAEPGGICLSGSVYDQIVNKLSLGFKELGEQQYKNIPQPVRTYTIAQSEAGTFPAPRRRQPAAGSGHHRAWIAAAVVAAIVVGGGGFWGYRIIEAQRLEAERREAQLAAERKAAEEQRRQEDERRKARRIELERQRQEAERRAAEEHRARLDAERRAAEEARRREEAERKGSAPSPTAAAPPPAATGTVAADGMWAGTFACKNRFDDALSFERPVRIAVNQGLWVGHVGTVDTPGYRVTRLSIAGDAATFEISGIGQNGRPYVSRWVGAYSGTQITAQGQTGVSNSQSCVYTLTKQ